MKQKRKVIRILAAITLLFTGLIPVKAMEYPDTVSENVYVLDYDNRQVLMDKGGEERIYPASMTKLMTALLFAENTTDWNDTLEITGEMLEGLAEANASVAGWSEGTVLDRNSVLHGILVVSGADAVNCAAISVSGSVEAFVDLMNEKASQLGMTNTHFVNPTGLHDDDHYSTCKDIAILLQNCLSNEKIREVLSTETFTDTSGLTMTNTWKKALMNGGYTVPGLLGGKTGYTNTAGHCFASFGELNGMKIISVTAAAHTSMYSNDHLLDAQTIYTWLENNCQRTKVLKGEEELKTITVKRLFDEETITVISPADYEMDVFEDASLSIETDLPNVVEIRSKAQTIEGTVYVKDNNETVYSTPITVTIPREESFFQRLILKVQEFFE